MNQLPNSEQLVIKRLRAQLKSKEADLEIARQQIFHLQSSSHQPQLAHPSKSHIADCYTDAHGDIPLSVVPVSQKVISSGNTSGKSHNRHHVDLRTSCQYPSGDEPHAHAVKRPRTMSQQGPASHKMDRIASNLSTRSAGPFTGSIPVSPLPTFQATDLQDKHSEQGNYLIHGGLVASQPFANLIQQIPTDNQQQQQQQQPQQQHGLSPLAEMEPLPTGVLVDPAVWLAAHEDPSPDFVIPFSSAPRQGDMDIPNPNMSVCGSMTSGTTYDNTAPMTRQNSQFDSHSVAGGVRMMNMGSQMSQVQDSYFSECSQQTAGCYDTSSFLEKPPSHEDALFAVGSSLPAIAGHHYASTTPSDGLLTSSDMERSLSSMSAASAKSTASSLSARAKDTLKQQNHRAQNAPLKPKPSIDENKTQPQSDEKNDGKAVITKTKYVRPRQPKVFCELCDEHKEGFRGEHELRRHKDAKHQSMVKKFICVDPQEFGLPVNVQVVNPLSKCKACKAQKKYGAYYNAAAHLRRTHFKEKPSRCKNRSSGVNGDDDKRGGKGGGDWPSMHELKNWMRETWVRQDKQRSKEDDDADEDIDNGQPLFGDAEMISSVAGSSSSSFDSPGLANIDYGFPNPLTINTVSADVAYMSTMPLSSADFTFNSSANMPLSFNAEVAGYQTMDHMNSLSSAVSSSATVTPRTAFNDAQQQHFDNISYQYTM